jgi:hypothetical protein
MALMVIATRRRPGPSIDGIDDLEGTPRTTLVCRRPDAVLTTRLGSAAWRARATVTLPAVFGELAVGSRRPAAHPGRWETLSCGGREPRTRTIDRPVLGEEHVLR